MKRPAGSLSSSALRRTSTINGVGESVSQTLAYSLIPSTYRISRMRTRTVR